MKKLFALVLTLGLVFSLCACDASDYKKAVAAYEKGDYSEAREIFEKLGDYKDSEEKAEECLEKEIDELLQGYWSGSNTTIKMSYRFNNGRFNAKLTVGSSSVSNEGTYRVDTEKQEIYVCYDYIISTNGKTPNTEEKMLFTYTYDGNKLTLIDSTNEKVTKD